jgi:glycosyltransferase involved in cell wall biosynthesis
VCGWLRRQVGDEMRILMLAQFYPPIIGGEERHVRNLSAALVRRGHTVSVATVWQHGLEEYEVDEGITVRRLRGTLQRCSPLFNDTGRKYAPPFPDLELTFGLRQLASRFKPDIVHGHNWLIHSFLPLKRRSGPRLVLTLHDMSLVCVQKNTMRSGVLCSGPAKSKCLRCAVDFYGPLKGPVAAVGNWTSSALERQTVDKFLAVSSAVAAGNRLADDGLPFEVVPNFVGDDIGTLSERGPTPEQLGREPYILFVGDLRRFKGIEVLLEAYAMLRSAPPLLLIGRRCPDTPRSLPPNAFILESWPHADVMHAWSRCLFGVAPSVLPEACASVVIEAMAFGKPMVVTDVGGMPDLVDHNATGLVVPPGNAGALSEAMRALIENPNLRASMGNAALRKAEKFKAKAVVPRIERIYEELVACAS